MQNYCIQFKAWSAWLTKSIKVHFQFHSDTRYLWNLHKENLWYLKSGNVCVILSEKYRHYSSLIVIYFLFSSEMMRNQTKLQKKKITHQRNCSLCANVRVVLIVLVKVIKTNWCYLFHRKDQPWLSDALKQ